VEKKSLNKHKSQAKNMDFNEQTGFLSVPKTYKLYIGGAFPRTESGRYTAMKNKQTDAITNISKASKKDFKAAVEAARKAQPAWAARSAYNKAQICYRIAEMLDARKSEFVAELEGAGLSASEAVKEIEDAVDLLVYYTGWADKFQQIYSTVNQVSGAYFNFSIGVPVGVVSVLTPENSGLAGLLAAFIPAFISGNTVIILSAEQFSLTAIAFAEVIHTSDVPAGTVNILTGSRNELVSAFTNHMDINSVIAYSDSVEERKLIEENAAINVKRSSIRTYSYTESLSPYLIFDTLENKTIWHPMGGSDGGGAKY